MLCHLEDDADLVGVVCFDVFACELSGGFFSGFSGFGLVVASSFPGAVSGSHLGGRFAVVDTFLDAEVDSSCFGSFSARGGVFHEILCGFGDREPVEAHPSAAEGVLVGMKRSRVMQESVVLQCQVNRPQLCADYFGHPA